MIRILITVISRIFTLYAIVLLARAFTTWVEANPYNPIVEFLYKVTEPVLKPIRRFLPKIRMDRYQIDLSVFVAVIVCFLLSEITRQILFVIFLK